MNIVARFILMLALITIQPGFTYADSKDIKLRFSIQEEPETPVYLNVNNFKDEAEKLSDKKISIEILDHDLFSFENIPNTVKSGAIDLGISQLGLYGDTAPASAFLQQPFLFDNRGLIRTALRRNGDIRALIEKAIAASTNSRVLWWYPYGSTVIVSRGGPLLTPDAIMDKMIVTADKGTAEFLSLCGARAHVFAEKSMHGMMQNNPAVDAVTTGMSGVATHELWQMADTITNIRHSQIVYVAAMNEDVWQGLPEDKQNILLEAARHVEDMQWDKFEQIEDDIYQLAQNKGLQIAEVASSDLVDWRACSSEMLENFMSRAGRDAADLMVAYGRMKAKQSQESRAKGTMQN